MRLTVMCLILLAAASARSGIEHTILNGVEVGRVRAWVSPEAIPGLSSEQLTTIVGSHLREAGIPVSRSGGAAALTVTVTSHGDSGSCFVTVEGNLVESATLQRNGMSVTASSWHHGASVTAAMPECETHTKRAVDAVVADFAEVYRAMNPGKAGGS
jgi:hypothetical protein